MTSKQTIKHTLFGLILILMMPLANATMIDFKSSNEAERWRPINDSVMGGRSQSGLWFDEGQSQFCGMLSLENNGGFASVRRLWSPGDSADGQSITLRFMGDGRPYQLRFRTNRRWDGVSYTATFPTSRGEWSDITLSESDFTATFRGWQVRDARPFKFSNVEQVGLMLADKRPGPFCIALDQMWLSD